MHPLGHFPSTPSKGAARQATEHFCVLFCEPPSPGHGQLGLHKQMPAGCLAPPLRPQEVGSPAASNPCPLSALLFPVAQVAWAPLAPGHWVSSDSHRAQHEDACLLASSCPLPPLFYLANSLSAIPPLSIHQHHPHILESCSAACPQEASSLRPNPSPAWLRHLHLFSPKPGYCCKALRPQHITQPQ